MAAETLSPINVLYFFRKFQLVRMLEYYQRFLKSQNIADIFPLLRPLLTFHPAEHIHYDRSRNSSKVLTLPPPPPSQGNKQTADGAGVSKLIFTYTYTPKFCSFVLV